MKSEKEVRKALLSATLDYEGLKTLLFSENLEFGEFDKHLAEYANFPGIIRTLKWVLGDLDHE